MKIDRARIVDEALRLLNEIGMDEFTTRELARRLGVRQPALYWHFASKRALLDAMNEEILARGHRRVVPLPGENWRSFLEENARSFRLALIAYRDAARIHAGTEANPADLRQVEKQLQCLVSAGMSPAFAMDLLVSIGRYIVGCVLEEQADASADPAARQTLDDAAAEFELVAEAIRHYRETGHAAAFEAGLGFLLDGAEAAMS